MSKSVRTLVSLSYFLLVSFISLSQDSLYHRISDGVVLYPNQSNGHIKAVMLRVVNDHSIRVTVSPEQEFPSVKSLITTYTQNPSIQWELINSDRDNIELRTKSLIAKVELI